jgi:hypothetical protein
MVACSQLLRSSAAPQEFLGRIYWPLQRGLEQSMPEQQYLQPCKDWMLSSVLLLLILEVAAAAACV